MRTKAKCKETELGMIPEDWQLVELGTLGDFRNGINFNRNDVGKGYPVINVKNLFRGRFATIDELDEVKEGTIKNIEAYSLRKGDILFARSSVKRSGAGQVAMVDQLPSKDTLFSGFIIRFRIKDDGKLLSDFLNYLLRSNIYREYLTRIATGTTIANLSQDNLSRIPIMLPNLHDQSTIAKSLSNLDSRIELNQQMNDTLEAIAQTIFKHWFIDFEFPNEKGNPYKSSGGEMVDSELGKIPRQWRIVALYSCAKYINGDAFRDNDFSSDRSGLPIIKIAELKHGITTETDFTNKNIDSKYKIYNGDILFSWSGSPDTSIDIFVWTGGEGYLNQHIFKVSIQNQNEKPFIFFLLRYLKKIFVEIARDKQTTGLGHVTANDLKKLLVIIPNNDIMKQFNTIASPIFNLMFYNRTNSHTLIQLRDLLLPKLTSGTIRVPVEVR